MPILHSTTGQSHQEKSPRSNERSFNIEDAPQQRMLPLLNNTFQRFDQYVNNEIVKERFSFHEGFSTNLDKANYLLNASLKPSVQNK